VESHPSRNEGWGSRLDSRFQKRLQLSLQFRSVSCFAVPNDKTFPTHSRYPGSISLVTFFIVSQLWEPISSIRFRRPSVNTPSMLVPKTTVDKNDFSPGWKNEVRATRQISAMQAETVPQTVRQGTDN
jgi:hypothetical protein